MWKELKEKLPKNIKWFSGDEKGNGVLTDIRIQNKYISFYVDDLVNGEFTLQAVRRYVSMYSYMNELHVTSPLFFEIVIYNDMRDADKN